MNERENNIHVALTLVIGYWLWIGLLLLVSR